MENLHVLRRREVEEKTGLSRAAIYKLMAESRFPAPVELTGPFAVGWLAHEIDAWLNERLQSRDGRVRRQRPRAHSAE